MRRDADTPITLRTLSAIHTFALGLSAGAILLTAAAAMIAFPTMRDLDPSIPGYDAVGDHWMIAAGAVMAKLFRLSDAALLAGVATAGLAFIGLVAATRGGKRPIGYFLRSLALFAMVAAVAHHAFLLTPRMNQELTAFWSAAERGDADAAEAHRAAFDADHPRASASLATILGLTVLTAAGAALPITRAESPSRGKAS